MSKWKMKLLLRVKFTHFILIRWTVKGLREELGMVCKKGVYLGVIKKRERKSVCVWVLCIVLSCLKQERETERKKIRVCECVCVCEWVFARGLYAFIFLSTQEFSFVNVRRNIILEFLSVLNFQLFCMILHMLSVIGDP